MAAQFKAARQQPYIKRWLRTNAMLIVFLPVVVFFSSRQSWGILFFFVLILIAGMISNINLSRFYITRVNVTDNNLIELEYWDYSTEKKVMLIPGVHSMSLENTDARSGRKKVIIRAGTAFLVQSEAFEWSKEDLTALYELFIGLRAIRNPEAVIKTA